MFRYPVPMAVAIVITSTDEAAALVGWGWQCARARQEDIVVFAAVGQDDAEDAEPLPAIRAAVSDRADAHVRMAAALHESAATGHDEPERSPEVEVVPVQGNAPAGDILKVLAEHGVKLLLLAKQSKAKGNEDPLPVRLFREAACMVVLMRLGAQSTGTGCRRVLIPTSGGPHATEALALANNIVRLPDPACPIDQGGRAGVEALYLEPDYGPEAELVGRRLLDKAIRKAVGDPAAHPGVRPVVEVARDFRAGLARVIEDGGYDLLLIGAGNQWHARKALFGMLPDKLLAEDSALTVGVVRQPKPLMTAAAERIRGLLSRGIPQLEREDRVTLVERVQSASQWNIDFVALICLSTMIATLGLMLDSVAVVIGAMLVAPLMTPLIGCGLAVVQGNGFLMRSASKSVLLGFLVALLIALLMGALIPHAGVTDQMLARGKPNALDLGVALISGIAAAYATARPNLLGALPGVAIAAALVPPIATAGVALSDGDALTAAGAVVLFVTNIIAIVLGAAAALFAVGMQAKHLHTKEKRWTRHALMGLTVGAVVLSVPLIYFLYDSLPKDDISPALEQAIEQHIETEDTAQLISVRAERRAGQPLLVWVAIAAEDRPPRALADDLRRLVEHELDRPCDLQVQTRLVTTSSSDR